MDLKKKTAYANVRGCQILDQTGNYKDALFF